VPLPQTLAKASWVCPLIVLGMLTVSRSVPRAKTIVDMVALLLEVVCFVLGVVSLFGIRRYGRKRILAPALVGILLNGFFIFVWVTNFMAAYERARAARGVAG
jgi:hypothetical protein